MSTRRNEVGVVAKHSIQGKVIAVSVRYWDAKEDYMKKLADTLKQLKRDGYHILFVPMHGPFDQNASRDIINLMGEEAHMLPYKLDIHEKISILSECSFNRYETSCAHTICRC